MLGVESGYSARAVCVLNCSSTQGNFYNVRKYLEEAIGSKNPVAESLGWCLGQDAEAAKAFLSLSQHQKTCLPEEVVFRPIQPEDHKILVRQQKLTRHI